MMHQSQLHLRSTCEHLQLGHQLLVAVILSAVRVVELQQAEAAVRQQKVPMGVLVGLVSSLSGHRDPPVLMSPDHIGLVRAAAPQADVMILRDRKPHHCWRRGADLKS